MRSTGTRLLAGIAAVGATVVLAADPQMDLKAKDQKVLERAPVVLQSLTTAPDSGIPRELLEDAECVMVFPNVTKGAFIVGGEHGRGVATCKHSGAMSPPAFFTVSGASVGWQFGGEQTDLVLLVMDKNGMDNLLRDNFKIGAEVKAAIGPVGRGAEASTDALLGAQILSWSRSEGAFVGASLDGAVIRGASESNARIYGRDITAREILQGNLPAPPEAAQFLQVASNLLGANGDVRTAGATTYTDTGVPASGEATTTSAGYTDRERLPQTASPLPLLLLGGLVSLIGAAGLRRSRRRALNGDR